MRAEERLHSSLEKHKPDKKINKGERHPIKVRAKMNVVWSTAAQTKINKVPFTLFVFLKKQAVKRKTVNEVADFEDVNVLPR